MKANFVCLLIGAAALLWGCSTRVSDRPQTATQENRPVAIEIIPVMGAVDVCPTDRIRVTFSEPIDRTTVNASTFLITNSTTSILAAGTITFNPIDTEVTFTPTSLLAVGDEFEIMLTAGIRDQEGSSLFISSAIPVPSRFTVSAAADTMPPSFGGAIAASAASEQAVRLTWAAASDLQTPTNEIVYLAYAETVSGGQDFASPIAVTPKGATALLVTGLQPGTTYFFVVRAMDCHGNIDGNAVEVSAPTNPLSDAIPPTFAGAVGALGVGPATIRLSWAAASDNLDLSSLIRYRIYLRPIGAIQDLTSPYQETAAGATGADVGGLAPGMYSFVVRAVDTSENEESNLVELSSPTVLSYAASIQPLFDMSCTTSACHIFINPAGGLDLMSYVGLASGGNSGPAFLPGDPARSLVIRRVDDQIQPPDPFFVPPRMPMGGLPLAPRETFNLRTWILQGANNN